MSLQALGMHNNSHFHVLGAQCCTLFRTPNIQVQLAGECSLRDWVSISSLWCQILCKECYGRVRRTVLQFNSTGGEVKKCHRLTKSLHLMSEGYRQMKQWLL